MSAMSAMDDAQRIHEFMIRIRKEQPPYCCFICNKPYRSLSGLDYHLKEVGHDENGKERSKIANSRPMNNTPKKGMVSSRPKNKGRKSGGLKSSKNSPAPGKKEMKSLTYSEAQRLVQVDLSGVLSRIPMSCELDLAVDGPPEEPTEVADNLMCEEEGAAVDGPMTGSKNQFSAESHSHSQKSTASSSNPSEDDVAESTDNQRSQSDLAARNGASENGKSPESCRKFPKRSCAASKNTVSKDIARPADTPKKARRTATSGACTSALPVAVVRMIEPPCADITLNEKNSYFRFIEKSAEELNDVVEYDMDEDDSEWLDGINAKRKKEGLPPVSRDTFELLMDRLEKESFFESRRDGANPIDPIMIDEDAVCCICNDGEAQNTNVILFCDMCNLAMHQECYGVPFIPEGQWLCRRCLNSPSCAVDCVLCPNKGGAFKQTEDGRWAHVVCALWIPEVQFANTVFLEPIDSINEIPGARWRLPCYICHRRGGACIQCVKGSCYTAFHPTCAQHAGLHMKMEIQKKKGDDSGPPGVRKVVFCDAHTPTSPDDIPELDEDPSVGKAIVSKPATATAPSSLLHKKLQAERRLNTMAAAPIVNIPFVPDNKLTNIAERVSFPKKAVFVYKLRSFWALKRQSRSGVPLLRRLQASHPSQKSGLETVTVDGLREQLAHWQRLRRDLERCRTLLELINKREKMKRVQLNMQQLMTELQLQPLTVLLRRTLQLLEKKDPVNIFAEPVSVVDVPDYLDIISQPMDFSTMRAKLDRHEYTSVVDFAADFQLLYRNCMTYNAKDTVYYRAAVRLRDSGTPLLRFARKQAEKAGIDPETGMHAEAVSLDPEALCQVLTEDLTLAEQLEDLKEEIEEVKSSSSVGKAVRIRSLRKQMASIRKQMNKEIVEKKLEAGVMTAEEAAAEVSDVPTPSVKLKSQKRRRGVGGGRGRKRSRLSESAAVCEAKTGSASDVDMDEEQDDRVGVSRSRLASPDPGLRPHRQRKPSERMRETDDFVLRCAAATRTSSCDFNVELPASSSTPVSPSAVLPMDEVTAEGDSSHATTAASQPVVSLPRIRHSLSDQVTGDLPSVDEESEDTAVRLRNGFDCEGREDGPLLTARDDNDQDIDLTDGGSGDETPIIIDSPAGRKRKRMERAADKTLSMSSPSPLVVGDDQFRFSNGDAEDADAAAGGDDSMPGVQLRPLDLVWAKCRGYPSYPALIIDPQMSPEEADIGGGVYLPQPPNSVLDLRPADDYHLVLFFDARRTWQWLPRDKLAPLGSCSTLDESKLTECRKPAARRSVSKAFSRALMHQIRAAPEDA